MKLAHTSHEGSLYMNDKYVIKVFNISQLDEIDLETVSRISVELSEKMPEYVPIVYQTLKLPGTLVMTMEKLKGQTLAESLSNDYTPSEIFQITSSLYSAVIRLHDLKYVHGDLHTGNIILDGNLRVKLIDFTQTVPITEVDPGDGITLQLYQEYCNLSAIMAQLFLSQKDLTIKNKSIYETIKQIGDFTVADVYGEGETAVKLFNMLDSLRPFWGYVDS